MRKDIVYSAAILTLVGLAFSQWREVRRLREDSAALQSRVDQLLAFPMNPASPPGAKPPRNPEGKDSVAKTGDAPLLAPGLSGEVDRSEATALRIRQQMDARMLALKSALSLTTDEEAAVRAVLEKGEIDREELHRNRTPAQQSVETPEKRKAELLKFAAVETAQEDAVNAVLSEEQRNRYAEHKDQARRTQAEELANSRLRHLQRNLSLSEEQKEEAFQFYAKQAMDFDPLQIALNGEDPAQVAEGQETEALRNLERILTAEQFGLFTRQAEEKAALNRK